MKLTIPKDKIAQKDRERDNREKKHAKIELADKKTQLPLLSASRLKMYLECPIKFKYKYLDKGEERASIYSVHGSSLHKAIELLHKEKINPVEIYIERMIKWSKADIIGADQFTRLYQEGLDILRSYDPSWYTPRIEKRKPVIEKWFSLKYPNDENPICIIRGYFDLIQLDSFVDFKSSKQKLSKKKVEEDLQFIIYYWAFNRIYGYYPQYGVYHRLPDHKQIVALSFNLDQLNIAVQTYINDPMLYDAIPCDRCSLYCGVRHVIH